MARTMLNENNLPKYFWAEAVNTACYVLNRVSLRPKLIKLLMNCGKIENLTFLISKSLDINAIFLTPKTI